MIATQQMD